MAVLIELLCFGYPVLSFLSLWYSQRAQKYIAESSVYKDEIVRLMDFFFFLPFGGSSSSDTALLLACCQADG